MGISEIDFECSNLIDLLRWRAIHQSQQWAYVYLSNGEAEGTRLSNAGLDRQARAIAAELQKARAIGERALLLYPEGPEFVAAFLGCLYAGLVAVPAPLPNQTRLKQALPKLQALVDDSQSSLVLTHSRNLSQLQETGPLSSLQLLATDRIADEQASPALAAQWQRPAIGDDTLAYLQYTSGSTSMPKGVMVGHGNLMRHCARIKQAWGYESDSIAATWLPHFHDYGLVDGLIQPLYSGIPCYVMSPVAFFARPLRWLQTISRYEVTHSQGPNFGYDHCVDRIKPEQSTGLDLRSWRTASNGAEPIAIRTIDRFVQAFQPHGFRRDAFYPSYGLAEATLLVSTKQHGRSPVARTVDAEALEQHKVVETPGEYPGKRVRTLVSCGPPIGDTRVVIVDPKTLTPCAPLEIGEIWVASPTMALGYWQRPEETAHTFQATLMPDGEGPFLRTGDVGFMQDGELYLTGRIKEVIIIRGRNHYPQDIELTVVQCHPALRPGYGTAFGLDVDGTERLIVVQEIQRQYLHKVDVGEIVGNIREAVSEHHEIQVHDVLLVKPGSIPKTSSGKIQQSVCRQQFVDGHLKGLEARW